MHVPESAGLEIETDAQRASIKGPMTMPLTTFDYLTVLSMPQALQCFGRSCNAAPTIRRSMAPNIN